MDDFDTETETDLFVSFTHNIKAIRVVGNRLIPVKMKLTTDVIYDDFNEDEEYHANCQIAFLKIRHWLDNCFTNSVIFNRENAWALHAFLNEKGAQSVQNRMVLTPGEPTDGLLAEIIQSKLNALGQGHIEFGSVELASDDTNGLTFIFVGDGQMNLPKMDEWIGERSFFSKPWWDRDDASTIDVIPDDEDDISVPPAFAYSLDHVGDHIRKKATKPAVIVRPEFRPTVIDGGKSDE